MPFLVRRNQNDGSHIFITELEGGFEVWTPSKKAAKRFDEGAAETCADGIRQYSTTEVDVVGTKAEESAT